MQFLIYVANILSDNSDNLNKLIDNNKKEKSINIFSNKILFLRSFGININEAQRQSNNFDNQISTLPCGHRYHVQCITEWMLKKHNICPMCREKMDVGIPDESIIEDDLQNELLNIQIDLHPAFALLVFQTINEELTWGAMALPALGGGWLAGLGGLAFV